MKPTENLFQVLIRLNALLTKFSRSYQYSEALQLFDQIHSSHLFRPDHYTLASTITACTGLRDFQAGKQLHGYVIRAGFENYTHVSNTLLSFYAKSDDLESVSRVFDEIPCPDVYSWTTILSAYTKAGCIGLACQMFEKNPQKDVAVWNAMITGCAAQGYEKIALDMFNEMHLLGIRHDHFTFASVLGLCSTGELLNLGMQVHSLAIKKGLLVSRVSVINALLTMYFSYGIIGDAYGVFDGARLCNQITFNAMIGGLMKWGRDVEALIMLKWMLESQFRPTGVTFVSILSASASSKVVMDFGIQIHAQVIRLGFGECSLVSNALISMYSSHGDLINAEVIFERLCVKDIVSWNSMIASYAQGNCYELAIMIFLRMQRDEIGPDEYTVGGLLACSENAEIAKMVQSFVIRIGLDSNTQVGNALISAFSKQGKMKEAYQVFYDMPSRNLISWNSIISGYLLNGFPEIGLQIFSELQLSDIKPDTFSLTIMLSACGSISSLRHGKQIHAYILRSGLDTETSLENALITLYAKCGVLNLSSKVFRRMNDRDAISWNSMVSAYGQHGRGQEAIQCFEAMRESGVQLDPVTFTTVLSACSHAGLVNYARQIFSSMFKDYGIEPGIDHYSCIIDLLGRAGALDEAERLINKMPFRPESRVWWVLLSACRDHGNVRLGKVAARYLLEIEPDNPAVYILLSNIYAAAGEWVEAAATREFMSRKGVMKKPGCSWMELVNPN
ncbi:pentatricopeptide repeat-containing protein At3g49740 [Aristolochia californica]|uniref:pentatricopeptide repeat-containing protein At3g49740 n=1 Tax=Aristolochia californica TaxID=171875 RepID=UPI0035DAE8A1